MAGNWNISKPTLRVHEWKFKFEPFGYQLKIEAELEVEDSFNLPPKSLYINYNFPNQKLEKNYFSFHNSSTANNKILRNTSFLNLGGDRYFARKVINLEKIFFTTKLELDARDLTVLKEGSSQNFFSWVNSLSYEKRFSFLYGNTHRVQHGQIIKLVKDWTVTDTGAKYNHHLIKFTPIDYKKIINDRIKNLWTIASLSSNKLSKAESTSLKIFLEGKEYSGQSKGVHMSLDGSSKNQLSARLNSDFEWRNNEPTLNGHSPYGLFIPLKKKGIIECEMMLFVGVGAYKIITDTPFEFTKQFSFDEKDQLKVEVQRIESIKFFEHLEKFKKVHF